MRVGKLIDLHTHSTASDGSMNPGELVRHAKASGLSAIALTDHDTVEGLQEALEEAEKVGIEVIPGVEISVVFKPEMHMLGYFPGKSYQKIKGVLEFLKKSRDERNPRIISKLNELGFNISMKDVEAVASGSIVGRPHVARIMVEKGYVRSMEEAFDKYLTPGRPAYFCKEKLTPEQGILEISKAGGVPVLAHPIYLGLNLNQLDNLLGRLAGIGLKGIEAYYVDNSQEETYNLVKLAHKYGLLATGGSDFHGSFKPQIVIGRGRGNLEVQYGILDQLRGLMA